MNCRVSPLSFVLFLCALSFAPWIRAAEPFPGSDTILGAYEKQLVAIRQAHDRDVENLREDYVRKVRELKRNAGRDHLWTQGIWAERNLRVLEDPDVQWFALLAEPHPPPEPLAKLNEEGRFRLEHLREQAVERVDRLHENTSIRLEELEKKNVRVGQIEAAVALRAARERLVEHTAHRNLIRNLQRYSPESARTQAGRALERTEKEQDAHPAPPGAWFPFRKENAVYEAFTRQVRARSAGYHAGPAAAIALGERQLHRGTRGLSLVAFVEREVVLRDSYDTYAFSSETERLIRDIGDLPYGALVVIAVRDDATRRFSGAAQSALARVGAAHGIQPLPYRSSYLMVGLKGLAPGHALEKHGMEAVELNLPASE